jgi:hypothetical protein
VGHILHPKVKEGEEFQFRFGRLMVVAGMVWRPVIEAETTPGN